MGDHTLPLLGCVPFLSPMTSSRGSCYQRHKRLHTHHTSTSISTRSYALIYRHPISSYLILFNIISLHIDGCAHMFVTHFD